MRSLSHLPIWRSLGTTQLDSLATADVNTGAYTISMLGNSVVQFVGHHKEVVEWIP